MFSYPACQEAACLFTPVRMFRRETTLSSTGTCRLDMPQLKPAAPMAPGDESAPGPDRLAKMDVDALAKYFSHPCPGQRASLTEVQPDRPIIATPREFMKAAMRARQSVQQRLQVRHILALIVGVPEIRY